MFNVAPVRPLLKPQPDGDWWQNLGSQGSQALEMVGWIFLSFQPCLDRPSNIANIPLYYSSRALVSLLPLRAIGKLAEMLAERG